MIKQFQGKVADGAKNTNLSPALSHKAEQPSNKTDSPKSNPNVAPTSDLSQIKVDLKQSPVAQSATQQKSATPLSSCSNSPSSVRINQNYDPNNIQKLPTNDNTSEHVINNNADADGDLDNLEDADSKPLLNSVVNSQIVANTKRTNNRYGKEDETATNREDGNNESETLISHN